MIERVLLSAVLSALTVGTLVVACGSEPPAQEDGLGGSAATAPALPPSNGPDAATPDPTFLEIPAIDARSSLIALGLTDQDCPANLTPCLAPPSVREPMQAGWYAGADPEFSGDEWHPGENGPAVIAGHVDGYGPDGRKGHPGIFARLGELAIGDEVFVERATGPALKFEVYAVEHHPKDAFPTQRVYVDPTEGPELRLVTCGGAFDRSSGHYTDNIIAFARQAA